MGPWRAGLKEPGRSHLRRWQSRPPSGDGRMSKYIIHSKGIEAAVTAEPEEESESK